MNIDTGGTEHCTDVAKRIPTNIPRPLFSRASTLPPPMYEGHLESKDRFAIKNIY
jgi:hypothetical protein